ncbi:ScpA family protein [uncultured Lactobacillus sp.]|uniref:segregation and condensation protein A n=1 Tax=uncultured Lactobacillus sp. TaxID=153152 RepID=UPI0026332167|nr:segregation/condensation protein A [uncultured Lactobacillus sp.]
MTTKDNDLTLDLPNFTGPLDLLLHLIRSQKIDIYDIPIAKITGQYLSHLAKWQELDLQIAGEYFVMASTLLRIKSQYLLPKNDFVEPEEQIEDPRSELVEQLVQYSVFQKVSEYFKQRNMQVPITVAKEPSIAKQKSIEPLPLGEITSDQLANTFSLIIHRFKMRQPNTGSIEVKETSIEDMTNYLSEKIKKVKKVSFFACLESFKTLDQVISLFLAVLELCRHHKLSVKQSHDFGDLTLENEQDDGK